MGTAHCLLTGLLTHWTLMMTKHYGGQSMVAPLQTVLVRRPDAAFGAADPLLWHYTEQPYLPLAQQEHDAFVNTLLGNGVEVVYHDAQLPDHADAIFVHDPALITEDHVYPGGA